MKIKYGALPTFQIREEKKRLQNAIFKLLPYKEESYELLDKYFESLMFRISGLNKLFMNQAEILTLLSLLESARNEEVFANYRKAILDACALVDSIKEADSDD